MNCSSFETLLTDYMDRSLEGPVLEAARSHLEKCDRCRRLRQEVTELRGELETFPWVRPPADLVHKILLKTTGLPRDRSWWADFVLPTVRPFLTQRFAFATLVLFVFLSLMVNVAGPPVGAVLSPSRLADSADRLTAEIGKSWARFADFRARFFTEVGLMAQDLYGRIDYHLITLMFESYNEEENQTPAEEGSPQGVPPGEQK